MRDFDPLQPRIPGGEHGGEWGTGGGALKKLGRLTMDEFFAAHGGDDAWHDQYGGNDGPSLILWHSGQASMYYPTGKGQSHAFVLSGMDSHSARQLADAVDWAAGHPKDKPEHLPNGPSGETRTVQLPDTEVHVGYGWEPGEEDGSYLDVIMTFPKGAAAGKSKTFTVDEAVNESASSLAGDLRALADDIDGKVYAGPTPGAGLRTTTRADWNPEVHPRNPADGKFVDKHGGIADAVESAAGAIVTAGGAVATAAEAGLLKPANLRAMRQVMRIKTNATPKIVKVLGPNTMKVAGHALTGVGAVLDGYQVHKSWGKDWGQVTFSTVSLGLTAASLFVPPAAMVLGAAGLGVGLLSNSDTVRAKVGEFTAPVWSDIDRGVKDLTKDFAKDFTSETQSIKAEVSRARQPKTAAAAIKHATGITNRGG